MHITERDRTAGIILGSAVIGSGAHVTVVAPVDNALEFVKHLWNNLLMVSLQSKQMQSLTPLKHAAAML